MNKLHRKQGLFITVSALLGMHALPLALNTASANDELPLVSIRVLAPQAVQAVTSYARRDIAIGTRDPRAASFSVTRTLYLNGEAIDRETLQQGARARVPGNSADLVEVDAGTVSFASPELGSDGYYAEHVQVATLDEKGEVLLLTQDVVFYEVRGDKLIPLSIHAYSDALSPPIQGVDRNGKATVLRAAAAVATPAGARQTKSAAQRID